ncbi:MAG: hypothetical protein WD768_02355 [Phycisphaeraceae bacterium]
MLLATLPGCSLFKGDGTARNARPAAEEGDHWLVRPERMRVYPSTRFAVYEKQVALEARIEFLDGMADPTKAVGEFRFEVYAATRDGEALDRDRLFNWNIPMLSMEQNREYYDAVTRAYLFRLGCDHLPANIDRVVLLVQFDPPTGPRLSTRAVIQLK